MTDRPTDRPNKFDKLTESDRSRGLSHSLEIPAFSISVNPYIMTLDCILASSSCSLPLIQKRCEVIHLPCGDGVLPRTTTTRAMCP
eukprot:scaffold103249_cov34-Tisochrysis_lutea.AAC.2